MTSPLDFVVPGEFSSGLSIGLLPSMLVATNDVPTEQQSVLPVALAKIITTVITTPIILLFPILAAVGIASLVAFGILGYAKPQEDFDSTEGSEDDY